MDADNSAIDGDQAARAGNRFGALERTFTLRQIIRFAAVQAIDAATIFLTLGLTFYLDQRPLLGNLWQSLAFLAAFAANASNCLLVSGLYSPSWRFENL